MPHIETTRRTKDQFPQRHEQRSYQIYLSTEDGHVHLTKPAKQRLQGTRDSLCHLTAQHRRLGISVLDVVSGYSIVFKSTLILPVRQNQPNVSNVANSDIFHGLVFQSAQFRTNQTKIINQKVNFIKAGTQNACQSSSRENQ